MEKWIFIWLVILTILYCVLIEFQINDQKQINELEKRKQDRFDFVTKKTDDETNSPTNSTK